MRILFLALSSAFSAIPGLAVIASGLGTPPGTGYRVLFGGVIEAFGALTLLLLWVNQGKLKRWSKHRVTRKVVLSGLACLVLISSYILLFRHSVVEHARGTAYYPLWVSGDIAQMVHYAGSREAAISEYGIGGVNSAISKMGSIPLAITSILLLLVYQGIFTSLALSFGLPGFYMNQQLLNNPATPQPTA